MTNEIGEMLKDAREENTTLTQKDISNMLGWSTAQYVSNIERGVAPPPLTVLKTWCGLVKIKPQQAKDVLLSAYESKIDRAFKGKK